MFNESVTDCEMGGAIPYTTLDHPEESNPKERVDEDHKFMVYKFNNANDFTITFSLEDLDEFAHKWGFEAALDVIRESILIHNHHKRAIKQLSAFVRNHSNKYESDYETLIEYIIEVM